MTLVAICQAVPELAKSYELGQTFITMLQARQANELDEWLCAAQASGIDELKSLARGLEQDKAAVRAGLTSRWSQGAIEGTINKLKLLKRQMYGRASFALLRKRVLAS